MSLPPLQFQKFDAGSLPHEGLRHGDLLAGKVTRIDPDRGALIDFNGSRAVFRPVPHLRVGDSVLAAVQKTDSTVKLVVLSELGTDITAKVVSVRSSEVLIRVGDAQLRAQLPPGSITPEPGDVVQGYLRISAGKPAIIIISSTPHMPAGQPPSSAPLQEPPHYAQVSHPPLDHPWALQNQIDGLSSLLQNLPEQLLSRWPWLDSLLKILQNMHIDPDSDNLVDHLAYSVKNSGIFLESRLLKSEDAPDPSIQNDLKFALLKNVQEFVRLLSGEKSASPVLGQISEKVAQLLDVVRAEQVQNLAFGPSRQFYCQLPLLGSAGLSALEILISPQEERQHKASMDFKNVILTVAVTTSKLGRIKAGIFIARGRMTCQFKTSRKWVADLIDKNAALLKLGIEKLNYSVVHIGCTVTADERELSIITGLLSSPKNGFTVYV